MIKKLTNQVQETSPDAQESMAPKKAAAKSKTAKKAVEEGLSSKDIKKEIRNWKADHHRV